MAKSKAHLEGRTQAERKKTRQKLGSLHSLAVQPATQRRYQAAVDKFLTFLNREGLDLPQKRVELDDLLSEYIEHLWSEGEGRALASDTVAGLQHSDPRLKGALPLTWRLLKVWSHNEIPNRAPPFPENVLLAMVGHALFHNECLFALSLMLGFYGMLRTGELTGLLQSQVEPGDGSGPAVISLGFTKSGKRHGAAESITVHVVEVVRRLVQWKHSKVKQLTPSPSAWRKLFSGTLCALGLETFGFRPYSLRRGGATFWFSKHGSMDRLMVQGRWSAPRTAKIYINEGVAILAQLNIPFGPLRGFLNIYHQALLVPLPQLERTRRSSSTGGTGKRKTRKRFALSCAFYG